MTHRILRSLVAIAVLVLAGCGIDTDSRPQQLATEDVPFDLLDPAPTTTTTEPSTALNKDFPFYLVQQVDDRSVLVEVIRQVPLDAGPTDIVRALIEPLTPSEEEEADGLTNRIPAATSLLVPATVNAEQRIVTINLSSDFTNISGLGLRSAFAQVVYTLTELEGIDRVRFLVQGEPVAVVTGDSSSTTEPVGRADYPTFAPERLDGG